MKKELSKIELLSVLPRAIIPKSYSSTNNSSLSSSSRPERIVWGRIFREIIVQERIFRGVSQSLCILYLSVGA
jgi:hypothetical protein